MPSHAESLECPFCKRTFKRNEHLTRHLRIHTRERPFGCPLCERRFTRQDTLKRHLLGHADEAGSTKLKDHHQLENAQWTEIDQLHEPQSGSVDLKAAGTDNLDWYESLVSTEQPVSEEFPSLVHYPHDVPDDSTSQIVFEPAQVPGLAIPSRPGPLEIIGSKDSSLQYSRNECLDSTSRGQPKDLKLPPELFNSMVDDYARKWLRDLCEK